MHNEIIKIPCPKCNEETISIYHRFKAYGFQKMMAASNRKMIPKIYPDRYRLLTEKCSNCGLNGNKLRPLLKEEGWL